MCLVSVIKRQIQFIVLTVFVPFQLSKKWFWRETGTGTTKVSLYRTLSNLDQETKIELKDHLLMRKVVRLASQTIEFIQVGICLLKVRFSSAIHLGIQFADTFSLVLSTLPRIEVREPVKSIPFFQWNLVSFYIGQPKDILKKYCLPCIRFGNK